MPSEEWPTTRVDVVSLSLDEQNVRLDLGSKTPSQDALIEDLFFNQSANDLARSIAAEGFFPNDPPIVVEEGKRLIVLEGNRRVAALKALLDPQILPKYKSQLEKLAASSPQLPIDNIAVMQAPSRAAAERIIARIHTTKSRRPWSTLRQAYFYYAQVDSGKRTVDQLVGDYPDVDVRRFVKMWEMHRIASSIQYEDADVARKVSQQSKFPISTLERIYDNEDFKNAFGLSFDKKSGQVQIARSKNDFLKAFEGVVSEVVNKTVTSRTLNTAEEIKKKIEIWSEPLKGKTTSKAIVASDFTPVAPPRADRKQKGLAPKDVVCSLKFPAIARMLEELQRIDYELLPNAAHDLLRSFLECSLKAYFDHAGVAIATKGGPGTFAYLKDVLLEAEAHFKTKKKALVQVIKAIQGNKDYLYSQDFLNSLNHNHTTFSTGRLVKDAWDQMEPLLRFILDPK